MENGKLFHLCTLEKRKRQRNICVLLFSKDVPENYHDEAKSSFHLFSREKFDRNRRTNISEKIRPRDFPISCFFEEYLNLRLMWGNRFETVAKLRARRIIRFIDQKLGEAT